MIFEDLVYLAVGFVTAFLVLEAEHVIETIIIMERRSMFLFKTTRD